MGDVITIVIGVAVIAWLWLLIGTLLYALLPEDMGEKHKRLIVFGGPATLVLLLVTVPFMVAWDALTEETP